MTPADAWDLILKTLALIGAIIGAIWTVHVYSDTKKKEFYSAFWNKKMELYIAVSEAASIIATTESQEEFVKNRAVFWGFFFGRLSVVEDESVKDAMQKFTAYFPSTGLPNKLPLDAGQQAYALSIALKQDLLKSWQHPFKELTSLPTSSSSGRATERRST